MSFRSLNNLIISRNSLRLQIVRLPKKGKGVCVCHSWIYFHCLMNSVCDETTIAKHRVCVCVCRWERVGDGEVRLTVDYRMRDICQVKAIAA